MATSTSSVRVAVRVRPLTESEQQHHCKNNITFVPNAPQINVGNDRSFTFDYTYPPLTSQQEVFDTCVIPLVNKYMEGYNSTILAYGQTGSGKTFSMGIGLDSAMNPVHEGIVPLFIKTLFEQLERKQTVENNQFEVSVSFLELYNEDIVDLLSPSKKEMPNLSIREDHHGNIHWSGVREEKVFNSKELFDYLKKGSIARTTASTDMNHTSSRSHAIFSVILKQTLFDVDPREHDNDDQLPVLDPLPTTGGKSPSISGSHISPASTTTAAILSPTSSTNSTASSLSNSSPLTGRTLISKFHFVDLAGSERLKRTNAVGDRAKEGISINSGLLALGNVISALGDESRKVSHIPYRDSKLTRLLQDSLGGNSQTLMLACVSPADLNHTETLNTLKYANRARNIRNRVTINQESTNSGGVGNPETEQRLKAIINKLRGQLQGNDDFLRAVNDEMDGLKLTVQQLEHSSQVMASELAHVKCERDLIQTKLQQQEQGGEIDDILQQMMNEYTLTIEQLQLQLQQQQRQHLSLTVQRDNSPPTPPAEEEDGQQLKQQQQQHHHQHDQVKDVKKKRHSYRIGSLRRSAKGRHRTSIGPSTSKASPKSDSSSTLRNNAKQIKASIRQDTQFIQATLASLDSLDLDSPTEEVSEDVFSAKPVSAKSCQPPMITPASLCRQLIQRFEKCVNGKQQLLQQLDQAEQQKRDSLQLLERKLAEEKQKKTQAQAQHKQKINELNQQHEQKQRKQLTELQTLRRKHTQLVNSSATTRTQQENAIRNLKTSLEDAKHEKKKAMKRMKQELNRYREKCQQHEREVEKSKRLEKQISQTKKKLERDLGQARALNKKLSDDHQTLQMQVKHMTLVKKAGNSSQQTTGLKIGGPCLLPTPPTSNVHHRSFGKRSVRKDTNAKFVSLQQRVIERKRLILRAITAYTKSQLPVDKIKELYEKRDRLVQEQEELLKERELVVQEQQKEQPDTGDIALTPQYMDERIEIITPQVDWLTYCIEQLEKSVSQTSCHGTKIVDDDWVDVVDQDIHIVTDVTTNETGKSGYDIALSLVRTLEKEETQLVCESLMEDLIQLKQDHDTQQMLTGHLATTLTRHQEALIRMRRQAMDDDPLGKGNHLRDRYYQQAFHGTTRIWNGLVLLAPSTQY
ncbi:uncharacterized protein BX664DRAFT_332435 [Halteromyces radiatus]|uniref:uncharacterized protein n=1 Tax=Halteromyces radiatus TaxID=101107 RepID=UPI00221ED3B2|nr:uncharacterized protein BX664DRAFT_332435 [Halteromyces radiatus]KAI8089213.1 hypothetical protein BX664DRAFT_332435 [Halteromyces radiatus]